jgi:hypothetical protein
MSRSLELLTNAIRILATSRGGIRDRLPTAAVELTLMRLNGQQELTSAQFAEYTGLSEELARIPGERDQGAIAATIEKMTDDEASQVAARIFALYQSVLHAS